LSYALSRLSYFSVAPTSTAFQGLKRIARYIGTHPHKPFFYPRNVPLDGTNLLRHEYDQGHYEETQVLNHLECFQDAGLAQNQTKKCRHWQTPHSSVPPQSSLLMELTATKFTHQKITSCQGKIDQKLNAQG
jgi:hypothetical protein